MAEDKRARRRAGRGARARRAAARRAIEPATVVVVLRGTAGAAGAARPTATAYVDVTGLAPGRYDLPVKIDPIADVRGRRAIEPATVAVRIR